MTAPDQPAFPCITGHFTDRDLHQQIISGGVSYSSGMTKREWMAAMAMQGIISGIVVPFQWHETEAGHWIDATASTSIKMADALLKALSDSR